MKLITLIDQLQKRMQAPLPGYAAQLGLYASQELEEYERHLKNVEQDTDQPTRQSSVLILLYEKDGQVFLPLIQRPEYDGVHSGQIALPGGKVEPEDQDIIATALRETWEEIGVAPEQITVIGLLTPVYIPPSRFWVNVVLGYSSSIPVFIPDKREVASVLEFPLEHLKDINQVEEREVVRAKLFKMKVPGYVFEDHFIWGATSMILTELRELIKN
jgi:8-oxo-dGTP pyrophosphatase MutT (NUDIX family)